MKISTTYRVSCKCGGKTGPALSMGACFVEAEKTGWTQFKEKTTTGTEITRWKCPKCSKLKTVPSNVPTKS